MKVIAGPVVNPTSFGQIEFWDHAIVVLDDDSLVVRVDSFPSKTELATALAELDYYNSNLKITRLTDTQFLCPGFVDLHAHAPQVRNLGIGLDYSLLEWLEKFTFPEEIYYRRDPEESQLEYEDRIRPIFQSMVKAMTANGTRVGCFFGSLIMDANKILLRVLTEEKHLTSYVGKVCMDCHSPSNYVERPEISTRGTEEFIQLVKSENHNQVWPVVTPRFALCCSSGVMTELAKLAQQHDIHIQTHLSENQLEIQRAQELYPGASHYAGIYDQCGLLGPKTILAHCVYLSEEEIKLLAQRGAVVAHCPNSNFALNSGILNIRKLIDAGIRVGLGTDIAGGYSISILDAMRQAIITSKAIYFHDKSSPPLTVEEAFSLGTICGMQALGIDNSIGHFSLGKKIDPLIIDLDACPTPRKPHETLRERLARFVFLGDDRWINQVV